MTLRDILLALFRYKWLSMGSFFGAIIIGVSATVFSDPLYEASTSVFVNINPEALTIADHENPLYRMNLEEVIHTEVEMATSLFLVERAVEAMKRDGLSLEDRTASLIKSSLNAIPVRKTSFLAITIRDKDAIFASKFLDALVLEYKNYRDQINETMTQREYYTQKLSEIDNRVVTLQTSLGEYKSSNEVLDVETQLRTMLGTREGIQESIRSLRGIVGEQEARSAQLNKTLADFHPEFLSSDIITAYPQLKSDYEEIIKVASEIRKSEKVFMDNNPELMSLRNRFLELSSEMKSLFVRAVKDNELFLDQKRRQLIELQSEYNQMSTRLEVLSSAEPSLLEMEENLTELLQLRRTISKKLEELNINADSRGDVAIEQVSRATTKPDPVEPNALFNIGLAFLFGIAFSIALPIYLQKTDNSIITAVQVSEILNVRNLATLRYRKGI